MKVIQKSVELATNNVAIHKTKKGNTSEHANARALFVHLARQRGYKGSEISRYFSMDGTSVYRYSKKYNELKNSFLKEHLAKVELECNSNIDLANSIQDQLECEIDFDLWSICEFGSDYIELELNNSENLIEYLDSIISEPSFYDYNKLTFLDNVPIFDKPEPERIFSIDGLELGGVEFMLTKTSQGFTLYNKTEKVLFNVDAGFQKNLKEFAHELTLEVMQAMYREGLFNYKDWA